MKINTLSEMELNLLVILYSQSHVSFYELCKKVPGFFGNYLMKIEGTDIVIWRGLSKESVEAMTNLFQRGLISYDPITPGIYLLEV